jgi:hypothetical protein
MHANVKYHVHHQIQPHPIISDHRSHTPSHSVVSTVNLFAHLPKISITSTFIQRQKAPHSKRDLIKKELHRPNSHPKSPHNRLALDPTPDIALRAIQIAIESQHLLELAVFQVDGRLAPLAVGDILGASGELGDWEGFDDGRHCCCCLSSVLDKEME